MKKSKREIDSHLPSFRSQLTLLRNEIIKRNQVPEDVDVSGDETDLVQGTFIVEMSNKLSARDHIAMVKIDKSIEKIDNNTYGICDECEEEIPLRRLQANLTCSCCVLCAEAAEKRK